MANDELMDISLTDEVLQPVQEICAIARLANEELKQNEKIVKPRRRVPVSTVSSRKKLLRHGKMMESALEVLKPEAPEISNAKEDGILMEWVGI